MCGTAGRLVSLLRLFATHTGLSVSTVSRLATGSGDTVARLQRGGAITTRRLDRTLRFLSDNWPDTVAWPADIPRPVPPRDNPEGSAPPDRRPG